MDIETQEPEVITPNQLAVIERAQVDIQIETAKKWPRSVSRVKERMIEYATLDEETAASCFYTLPRAGKNIQGPSIRMAEIAVTSFGNLRAETRIVDVSPTGPNPSATVMAMVHDLESNTAIRMEKRRRIMKKKKSSAPDDDDINNAVNLCSSIALRDTVFKVVPLSLIKPVVERAKKVAIGDATSFGAQRQKVIDRLKQMGAKEDNIFAAVSARKIEDVDEDKLSQLIGLGTSIKNGDITIEEAFPDVKREVPTEGMFGPAKREIPPIGTTVSKTVANPDGTTTYTGPATAAAEPPPAQPTPPPAKLKRAPRAATPPPTPPPAPTPPPVNDTPAARLAELWGNKGLDFPALCAAAENIGVAGLDGSATGMNDIPSEYAEVLLDNIDDLMKAAGV